MKTTDFIKTNLETGHSIIGGLLDDMKDAPLTAPTSEGGNHPLWILGHLAYSQANIVYSIMQGKENPLADWSDVFGAGSEPTPDASRYPAWDEVRSKFDDVQRAALEFLATLTDDDLDQPAKNCPPERESFFGTVGQCFLVMGLHTMMHYGQVADSRRMAGRKPLMA